MAVDFKKIIEALPEGHSIEVPIFENYIMPHGLLTPDPVEHALFYYYVNARRTYEEHVMDKPVQYDDESDPEFNFRELFTSIAGLYDVNPEHMVNAWDTIDRQCDLLQLPKMPDEYQYRFVHTASVIIQ